MNPSKILYVLIFNAFVSSIRSESLEDPFIFDPYTREMFDLENIASSKHDGLFALACPAETQTELEFDRDISFDGKALFVRRLHKKDNPSLRKFKCKKTYRMAVVYHKLVNRFRLLEFGYEIYYQISQVEEGFKLDDADIVFGTAEEMDSKMKRVHQFFTRPYLPDVHKRFVWISKTMFRYNRSEWSVKWIAYNMKVKVDQLKASCQNSDLGFRLYKPEKEPKLEDFYSIENQQAIFSQLKLPESVDGICKSNNECVKAYNLVRPYRFQGAVSGPIECSDLTSIPIWYKRTEELLDYTEQFLVALGQTVGNKIVVLTEVHDTLAFPKKDQKKPKPKPIFLDTKNNRIPVHRIISKIVTSAAKPDDCDKDKSKSTCNFSVAIIIHNEPEIVPERKLCEDGCTAWGWDSIQYLSSTKKQDRSQFIYCCKVDKNLRKKLNLIKHKTMDEVLNLKSFNYYVGKNDSPKRFNPDIQKEVEDKMNEIFAPKLDLILDIDHDK